MNSVHLSTNHRQQAKTLQERFGFLDHELSTPLHDEIVLWLDEHMVEVASDLFPGWTNSDVATATQFGVTLPPHAPPTIYSKMWEAPVLSNNKFTIGFVDMLCSVGVSMLSQSCKSAPYHRDRCAECYIGLYLERVSLAFEVKTETPSVGELVRQIRLYQTYLPDTRFVVVAPDARWALPLKGQGIEFVPYWP